MNVSLTDELKDFVHKKVLSGAFPSEEAVLQEAVRRLRAQDATSDELIDWEAIESCSREVEGKDVPSIEEVRRRLSQIPVSMAHAVIEEREERF
jgi:putative addiction module CopG family antidote